jgi:hypothetical protein
MASGGRVGCERLGASVTCTDRQVRRWLLCPLPARGEDGCAKGVHHVVGVDDLPLLPEDEDDTQPVALEHGHLVLVQKVGEHRLGAVDDHLLAVHVEAQPRTANVAKGQHQVGPEGAGHVVAVGVPAHLQTGGGQGGEEEMEGCGR